MGNIKIGSFNTRDDAINRKGGLREDGSSNADTVAELIKNFDLLGTQELTIRYVNEIVSKLKEYKFYGNYRYGRVLAKIPYNENNNIITNRNVLSEKTVWLPWIANNIADLHGSITKMSIMPRIATIVILEDEENKKICMINTHLDYQIPSIQIRQLEALKKIINKYGREYPIILTGDFNMELGDPKFDSFVADVKDTLQHADIKGKTWFGNNGKESAVDHIFVPSDWKIEDAGIISSKGTSDHNIPWVSVDYESNVKKK